MGLRLVFLTPEEPSVMPLFYERAIPALGDRIAEIVIVSPIYRNSSWTKQARRFIGAFGVRDFLMESMVFAKDKAGDVTKRATSVGRFRTVRSVARAHGVPTHHVEDVNDPEFLDRLEAMSPDLVISVTCPQILKRRLLELPPLGCINVHSALLPHYRGMLPTFWVLANGERHTGVTVHYMTPGIDGGDIIGQVTIPIAPDDSLRSLMRKCKAAAADLVVDVVKRFERGSVSVLPNPPDEGSYFSFPGKEDVARFRALGRKVR
jgi:methionyl-tRNA formyltransferase